MKRTLTTLLALLLIVGTMRAEDTIVMDTILWNQLGKSGTKELQERIKRAQERMKIAEEMIRKHSHNFSDSIPHSKQDWDRKLRSLPKGWLDEYESIDLPKDQKPLIDLSNIKGRWGFEDYYFSGDIMHAQFRRQGDFYIGGWNIRPLLPYLSGLLVLKSKKKAAEKIIFTRGTQLRNDKRFQPIVRHRGITIYGHHTDNELLDEVIILQSRAQSPDSEYTYIVQMMGRLRPDDLVSYTQILEPLPKNLRVKQ